MANKSKNDSKIDKSKAIDIESENNLLLTNPLMSSAVISPNEEQELKIQTINDIESLVELNKQQLSVKRQKIELEVDNKKLDTAKKVIEGIEAIADKIISPGTLNKIMNKEDLSPMDLKFLAESMDKMSSVLKNLMNPSVADEMGTKKKKKINFMFKSSGTVQGAIQIDDSDD